MHLLKLGSEHAQSVQGKFTTRHPKVFQPVPLQDNLVTCEVAQYRYRGTNTASGGRFPAISNSAGSFRLILRKCGSVMRRENVELIRCLHHSMIITRMITSAVRLPVLPVLQYLSMHQGHASSGPPPRKQATWVTDRIRLPCTGTSD